jgi:ABC-type polysaccharide/polyol phosphate export permease
VTRPLRQQVELVLSLAKRDLKTRYKESVLGFFWSLGRPAFLTFILWAVFSLILRSGFTAEARVPYWLHLLASMLAWNYFVGSLFDATGSILTNGNLIKKVKVDAEVFPISCIVANAVHFVLALVVFFAVMLLLGIRIHWNVIFLPFVFGVQTLIILGLSFYLSALHVFYRDVGSLFELVALAWFYVTPIIYPLHVATDQIRPRLGDVWFDLYMLNPMTPVIVATRRVLLYGGGIPSEIPGHLLIAYLTAAALVGLFLTITGWHLFHHLSRRFADEV